MFFIDLAQYRIERYYGNLEFWRESGIHASYLVISSRWRLLGTILALLIQRPDFVVVNMWLLKTRIVMLFACLVGSKVVYWQHGIDSYNTFYTYPKIINRFIVVEQAFVLSKVARESICRIGIKVKQIDNLPYQHFNHVESYQSEKKVLYYISQLTFPAEDDPMFEKYPSFKASLQTMEECLSNIIDFAKKNESEYELLIKKHPGDKTKNIEKHICSNIKIVDYFCWADCYIGHYSTTLIAAISTNKTIILPHENVVEVFDFRPYVSEKAATNIHELKSRDQISKELKKKKKKPPIMPNIIDPVLC
ncbi:hypothetical protein KC799_27765 [candidate division KSB1 bacterium]|nr:hypothetical protein [candidate division KSB1 bacterium]